MFEIKLKYRKIMVACSLLTIILGIPITLFYGLLVGIVCQVIGFVCLILSTRGVAEQMERENKR